MFVNDITIEPSTTVSLETLFNALAFVINHTQHLETLNRWHMYTMLSATVTSSINNLRFLSGMVIITTYFKDLW